MAHRLPDFVRQSSTSTGSTTVALTGAARKPYRSFGAALSNGDTTDVVVVDRATGLEQAATYSYSSGVLTFVEFISSSTGSQVDFPAGTKEVYPAWTGKRAEETLDRLTTLEESVASVEYLQLFPGLSTPLGVATAFNDAVDRIWANGGVGVIDIPPGDFTLGVPAANQVSGGDADGEGAAVKLEAGVSVTVRGAGKGKTILRSATNKIEMFIVLGATKTVFEGITFRSPSVLTLQVRPGSKTPGGGVAGLGNAANCAIRQYFGADLRAWNCEFFNFCHATEYQGNYLDDTVLSGTVDIQYNDYYGCAFGLLTQQPEHTICNHNGWFDGVDSIRSTGAHDPGHLVYEAHPTGARPLTGSACHNRWNNCSSSPIKLRKSRQQTIIGNKGTSHRGCESHNADTITATGNNITITDVTPGSDNNQNCFEITGCKYGGTFTGNTLTMLGAKGWCFRVRPADVDEDTEDSAGQLPRNLLIANNTFMSDGAGLVDDVPATKPWAIIRGATDLTIKDNETRHIHSYDEEGAPVVNTINEYAYDIDTSTRVRLVGKNAKRTAAMGSPTGSDKLVFFGSGCTDCTAILSRQDIDVAPTSNTRGGTGTNTRVIWTDEGAPSIEGSNFTVPDWLNSFINNKSGSDLTVTLPDPALNVGRKLAFTNYRAFAVLSASSNIGALGTGTASATILPPGYGRWAELRSDGTQWAILRAGDGDGSTFVGTSTGATGEAIGYSPGLGVGNSITQGSGSGKATGVTLNRATGQITMNNATLAAGASVSFVLTCNDIEANDMLLLSHKSGGNLGDYRFAHRCAAGSATILVTNATAGDLSVAVVMQYAVIKGTIT